MSAEETRENEKRIRELSAAPPVALVTRRAKFLQVARNVAAVVAFVAMGLGLYTLNQQSNATHTAQVQVCAQGNDARKQIKQLWQYIIDTSKKGNPHPTARQASLLADFQKRVDAAYALRDCTHPGK